MVGTLEEKIREEAKEDWDIDKQKALEIKQYKETALKLIAKAVTQEDLKEIKEIIQELEDEIGKI